MDIIKVTRKTIFGFGYTSACENDERGNLQVCKTTAPIHVGTLKTISEKIRSDRTLQSFVNTYYSSAWFVRHNGEWREVTDEYFGEKTDDLYEKDMHGEYRADVVTIEIADRKERELGDTSKSRRRPR